MVYQTRNIVTESERNRISSIHGFVPKKRNYIFEACVTVDGRYFVIQDEVFDIQEQKTIGNLWGSLDVFKTIFESIKLEDEGYSQIRENVLSLPILESQQNLYGLRDILLEFNFLQDTWLGRQFKSAGNSVADFAKTSYEGVKKFGLAISQGDWMGILKLLGQGVKYVLRKLKDALYSNLGMIVDAILIASGVGAGATKIAWGMVVALDAYQLLTDDWPEEEKNDPFWLKCLFFGFDILGFTTAAAAAKAAKAGITPIKAFANSPAKIAQYFEKNPKVKGMITSMMEGIKQVPALLQSVMKTLATKFPKGASFINGILGGLKSLSTRFTESLQRLLGQKAGKGASAGAKTTGILYGFEKAIGGHETKGATMAAGAMANNMDPMVADQYAELVRTKYNGKDPFD
jgi:hypothetical protein